MSVVVLGASGQVATALRDARGLSCLGRAEADFHDPKAVLAALDAAAPSCIINAAAYTAVDKAETEAEMAFQLNANTPGAVARWAAARDIPLLHISTDYVFDGSGSAAWTPSAKIAPLSVYGRSKAEGEAQIVSAGGPHVILRTSWVFSAVGSNFVKTMLRLGAERERLSIVADQYGGPTGAQDIAATLLQISDSYAAGQGRSGIYHFSGAPDASWADIAREIFAQAGLAVEVQDIATRDYPTPATRPLNSRLDCADIARDYGIEQPDWRVALARVLDELESENAA